MPSKQPRPYPSQRKRLAELGERLRLARLRRRLSVGIACERAGISRMTLYRMEAGSAAVALGTLLRVLAVLGLDSDIDLVARDDKVGRLLQDRELPPRRRSGTSQRQPLQKDVKPS